MEDKIVLHESFLNENPIRIGINEFGKFVAQYSNGNLEILSHAEKFGVIRLMELEYYDFRDIISRMIENFQEIRPSIDKVEEFPYEQIVSEALRSESDYWIELAFNWMHALGPINFSNDILEVINNKKISQKTRHKILKLKNK